MPLRRRGFFGAIGSVAEWCFGVVALFVDWRSWPRSRSGSSSRSATCSSERARGRSGRLRDGFIGVRTAARFGGIALAGFLLWLPLYFLSIQAEAARIIDPNGLIARRWELGLSILGALFALHAGAALLRGGRLRSFLNPLNVVWLAIRTFRGGLYISPRSRSGTRIAVPCRASAAGSRAHRNAPRKPAPSQK